MPTRLPTRRNLLRRYAPDRETRRNLVATFGEFALAFAFVTVTIIVIYMVGRGNLAVVPPTQPAVATAFAP